MRVMYLTCFNLIQLSKIHLNQLTQCCPILCNLNTVQDELFFKKILRYSVNNYSNINLTILKYLTFLFNVFFFFFFFFITLPILQKTENHHFPEFFCLSPFLSWRSRGKSLYSHLAENMQCVSV